jgi:hypothetical protein
MSVRLPPTFIVATPAAAGERGAAEAAQVKGSSGSLGAWQFVAIVGLAMQAFVPDAQLGGDGPQRRHPTGGYGRSHSHKRQQAASACL